MILVIDNYDSFTYNLVQRLGELGAEIKVFRNDKITACEAEALAPSHLIVSPGPCTPNEAGISNDVIRHFAGKIPVLGVCLGHQCIADAFGGKVTRADREGEPDPSRWEDGLSRPAQPVCRDAVPFADRPGRRRAERVRGDGVDRAGEGDHGHPA